MGTNLTPEYDSLANSSRVKMPSSGGGDGEAALTAGPLPSTVVNRIKSRYRECMKNHALGIGGHAVDGCGEFIAAGPDGTLDALKCAACNCHRNFHRKEPEQPSLADLYFHHHHGPPQFTPYFRPPSGYLQIGTQPHQRPLALPSTSGGGGAQSTEDYYDVVSNHGSGSMMRKRFRSRFTAEQKEKMLGLAERLGWRIQRQDDVVVQEFCNETGIKRHVLKVWMHNNKHTLGKKP